jgi:GxxExxY protein
MNTNGHELLGHGLWEKPYENALVVEFGLKAIPYLQQPRYEVNYKNVRVGEYVSDLIAFSQIVVDAKTIDCITDEQRGQILNYIKNYETQSWIDPQFQTSETRMGALGPLTSFVSIGVHSWFYIPLRRVDVR